MKNNSKYHALVALALLSLLCCSGSALAVQVEGKAQQEKAEPGAVAPRAQDPSQEAQNAKPVTERMIRQGVAVEFSATPSPGRSMTGNEIFAGDYIDVSFRLTDADTGQPLQGQAPGVWMDLAKSWEGDHTINTSCKDRVGLYLRGLVGVRPLLDLNSYFILVMNRDPTIAVIDPVTGVSGITKLYAQINLKHPGADWAITEDQKRLFVTMPLGNQLAVINTDTFKVTDYVEAGTKPMRIVRQPDGKYLWVGNDAEGADGGLTVIDAGTLEVAGRIATGRGHHEIVISADSRYVFVTNRDQGTVSVIDVERLEKIKDIETGPLPISLDFSALSEALYVADSDKGQIVVVDGRRLEVTARIETEPGLGPLRFSQDGRWGVALNSNQDLAYVIDPSTNRIAHSISVGKQPYKVSFSRSFAYVRSLGTERISMIDLSELGKPETVPVVTFAAGQRAPEQAKDISIADAIVEAPGEAAVLVVSPADSTVYYYMEGMNAPMGNFRNYGHMPRAVFVVDRSMQEQETGLYSSTVRIPDSGTYEVAFLLDSPSILHCFEMKARPNPLLEVKGPPLGVEFLNQRQRVEVGETVQFRFKLTDRKTSSPRTDLKDVEVFYFAAPGGRRTRVQARHDQEGIYQAALPIPEAGAYYIYVACPSQNVKPADLPFTTLLAGVGRRTPLNQ